MRDGFHDGLMRKWLKKTPFNSGADTNKDSKAAIILITFANPDCCVSMYVFLFTLFDAKSDGHRMSEFGIRDFFYMDSLTLGVRVLFDVGILIFRSFRDLRVLFSPRL